MKTEELKAGDLVMKVRGMRYGKTGVIVRVYNRDNVGHVILAVLCDGHIMKWSEDWVQKVETIIDQPT